MPKALLFIANGSEELEVTSIFDVLKRGHVDVRLVSLTESVTCSRGLRVIPDSVFCNADFESYKSADAVILPGGLEGAKAFAASSDLHALLCSFWKCGKIVAAICAAPIALKAAGIGGGKKATAYPSLFQQLSGYYNCVDQRTVVDGHLVTSQGPATAVEFALAILCCLTSESNSDNVAQQILYHGSK